MIKAYIFLVAGVLTWTFLEYIIHRFLGHKAGKGIIKKEHQQHHAKAHYFAPMYKKMILALIVFTVSTLLVGSIASWLMGAFYSLGLAGMYFIYEITHRRFHVKDPLIKYGLRMRKHHFFHHFGNPKVNHGVTTALWDRVFGTFTKTDMVKVPSKMAMVWLKDEDQELKPKYVPHFFLK